MKLFQYTIVIERDGKGYAAYCPDMPGCCSNGATADMARRNMVEAVQQHLGVLIEHGSPLPKSRTYIKTETVTVGVP